MNSCCDQVLKLINFLHFFYTTRRSCTADIPIRLGTIPKGSIILFNLLKIHKQKRNWGPRSNEFYPEHFSPENMVDMHPYKYLAFSGGNRNCIGLKYAYSSTKVNRKL